MDTAITAFYEVLGVIGIVLTAVLYFVPTLVAYRRNEPHLLSVFIFNLLLGFTFIGWVFAAAFVCRGITFDSITKLNKE